MTAASGVVIVVAGSDESAIELAQRIGCANVDEIPQRATHVLRWCNDRLEIAPADGRQHGITVDFTTGDAERRARQAHRNTPLARAVGIGKGLRRVVDATAGLGRDAWVLAALGCDVRMIERAPVLAALLEDGLRRLNCGKAHLNALAGRLRLACGDAIEILAQCQGEAPEVVYLDPMFPPRTKSALVKKEMQLLHTLLGPDPDIDHLLDAARAAASKRVVVKRPLHAEPIRAGADAVFRGSRVRWDVYLTPPPDQ